MISQNEINKIKQETDIAIKKGFDNTEIEWRKSALMVIYNLCTQESTLTANDFTEMIKEMPLKTRDNRAIGGVVRMAQKFRWITKTGESEFSKAGHLLKIQVWKSLLFGKVADEDNVLGVYPKMEWKRSSRTFVNLGCGNFVVNGTKGKQYRVNISEKGISCECDAFKYSKDRMCRHIRLIIASQRKTEEKKVGEEIEKSKIPLL